MLATNDHPFSRGSAATIFRESVDHRNSLGR